MKSTITCLVSLLIFGCGSGPQHGPLQNKQASVAGRVELSIERKPVADARVMVMGKAPDSTPWYAEGVTDADGRFCVGALPANTPIVIVVSKVMPGMEWFQVQAEATLAPGERRDLGVLSGGLRPPPLATPENERLLEPQKR